LEHEKNKEDFYKNHCLLEQAFVKDPGITVKDYLGSMIAKLGENIVIRRFVRYKVGE
jgi:elongation factor Ts